MNPIIEILLALSFGGSAWGLLVVSDWLLGEKPAKEMRRPPSVASRSAGSVLSTTSRTNYSDRDHSAAATTAAPRRNRIADHFPGSHRQMG